MIVQLPVRRVTARRWLLLGFLAACAALTSVFAALSVSAPGSSATGTAARPRLSPGPFPPPPAQRALICGRQVLRSPFWYDGRPGPYMSGTPGLPTYGTPHSDFPSASSGVVLAAGRANYSSFQLRPGTVYYLLPGIHIGAIQADAGDAFVGSRQGTVLSGDYSGLPWAIDSNPSDGDQRGVTVEYLTIEKYQPPGNSAAVNPDSNTGWTVQYDTVTRNVPGAGVILGADNVLRGNCLTRNGQYGFQSEDTNAWGADALTGGPYDLTVTGNEISYNDTCDFSGLLSNATFGWHGHDPVPAAYRDPHCGHVTGDGDQGGFKLWRTNGVTIADNYIHDNWGVGGWADTNNANTTWTGNTITGNESAAITEEISYNFSITGNYIAGNNIADGLANSKFPSPAIYISESGSDRTFGGVPACAEPTCARQPSYPHESVISGNTLVNNGGSIFLWQNSNRYCSDGADHVCTLAGGGKFTISSCAANLPTAAVNTETFTGQVTGSPPADYFDGCTWKTENVRITQNVIDFNPAAIPGCSQLAWPACGAGGVFSEYGSNPSHAPSWVIPTALTFFQGNTWSDNAYDGPSTFYAWNQGNGDNPVSWAQWTGKGSAATRCGSAGIRQSGFCAGPFGQDAGSVYR